MDAAEIKPKLIPDDKLQTRDNSGGIGFSPYTMEWDDGGYVFGGAKAHLSAGGGSKKSGGDEKGHSNRKYDKAVDSED